MRRALLAALLLLPACAGMDAPEAAAPLPVQVLAARLPDQVANQRRGPTGPAPDMVARYGTLGGSYTSVFLTPDPDGDAAPDGAAGPGLRAEFLRSVAAMAQTVRGRGAPAGSAAETTLRLPDGSALLCGAIPVAKPALAPASAEVVCLTRVAGSLAKIRMTAFAPAVESALTEALSVAAEITLALRRDAGPALPPGRGPIYRL